MITIILNTKSKKKEVLTFINELKEILDDRSFDSLSDFTLILKNKAGNDYKYSTPYTLLDLEYDVLDVINKLKELCVEEYSETKIDKDDINTPMLFVFGKVINRKLVYIKVKIKKHSKRRVLCVSFHYAKNKMKFPFACAEEKRGAK